MIKINEEVAKKVKNVVCKGLCSGLGKPKPGHMCVEAAVAYALGLEFNDEPECVNDEVRNIKIALNDQGWSSNKARSRGLLKVAIAQLGSNSLRNDFYCDFEESVRENYFPYVMNELGEFKGSEWIDSLQNLLGCIGDGFNHWTIVDDIDNLLMYTRDLLKFTKKPHKNMDRFLTKLADCLLPCLKKSKGYKYLYLVK